MKIGIFAYPTFLTDRYGGITLLNHTYDYLKRAGYDVHRFDPWTHRIEDFDLIHHFGLEYCNYYWFLTVKATGTKLAVTPIYWLPDLSRSQRLAYKYLSHLSMLKPPPALVRLMLETADFILPKSEAERQLLFDLYSVPKEKTAIVPDGVSDRFVGADPKPFKQRYGMDDFLLCVGRFDPRQKNQLGLIRALKNFSDVPLVFVGSPSVGSEDYFNQCKKEASPSTLFIDFLKPEDDLLASAFAAANTLVVPSFFEYPCLVAMEALLAGTKVAITTGGTTREIFKQYVNYLDPHSESDMRAAITRTYESDLSDEAKEYARKTFLFDNVGRLLEEAYRKAGFIDRRTSF